MCPAVCVLAVCFRLVFAAAVSRLRQRISGVVRWRVVCTDSVNETWPGGKSNNCSGYFPFFVCLVSSCGIDRRTHLSQTPVCFRSLDCPDCSANMKRHSLVLRVFVFGVQPLLPHSSTMIYFLKYTSRIFNTVTLVT